MKVHYEIVEHDGGWAYKLGDVFSETFVTKAQAVDAANHAAGEQKVAGTSGDIEFQDEKGKWHREFADGHDRPDADVVGSS